ncbi:MAG: AAA family ATPase, partial [Bacteroidales bacterium]|nr:AAA family ATPase [Bacteroidales bacterium]
MSKKIPYGQSNFEKIIIEDYVYVDKTKFIEFLEQETTDFHFLIRPRKFGKSLFLSMLQYYYDVSKAD